MKTKNLLGVLLLFTFTFISCDKEVSIRRNAPFTL